MPGVEFLRDQVARERERADRERRRGNWSYGIMVCALIVAIVVGYLWFRADNRAEELGRDMVAQKQEHDRQLDREKRINDESSRRIARLWSANSMLVGSVTYERSQAGRYEARSIQTQRKVDDLREDVERLRTNWTSELGVDP